MRSLCHPISSSKWKVRAFHYPERYLDAVTSLFFFFFFAGAIVNPFGWIEKKKKVIQNTSMFASSLFVRVLESLLLAFHEVCMEI